MSFFQSANRKQESYKTTINHDSKHGSPSRHHGTVMSCQSLSCDTDPLANFHRSVHFSDPERKSMECSIDYHGEDTSDAGKSIQSGSWSSAWSRSMSRSAPASCPTPLISGPSSLENANTSTTARFPRLEECAHFHYGRVRLGGFQVHPVENDSYTAHSQGEYNEGWVTLRVRPHSDSGDRANSSDDSRDQFMHNDQNADCVEWMVTRNAENFKMLDTMLHRCIYDRKVSGLPDLSIGINKTSPEDRESYYSLIADYLHHFSIIADDTINCGPILNWFQMDNKGHKLLVASEDCNSINTPALAAAYSVRRYVSQARDEISFEVGDMISVIDMPGASESTWWRGKRGFRVGFFPQDCVAVIGDKVPRNMKQPPPIVGSVAMAPIKPVLRKHGKLISLFRSFILSRPSRRSLRQQGILKERVFGCDLGEHLLNSGHEVPQVLSWCAKIIEEHGCVDGIYRLSGAASATQRLRFAFDEERPPPSPPSPLDVHAVASLLKMYFRELPNPLCTYQLYSCFVSAVKSAESSDGTELRRLDEAEKLIRMRDTVMKLPPPHYRTLAFLMRHLHGMSLLSANTGMTARNMGIVWAPNLLRSPHQEFSLSGVAIQVVVTEFLICYADIIFSDDQHLQDGPDNHNTNGSIDSVEDQASALVKRPKSLPLATPTKLLSLEEARNKQQLRPSISKDPHYIEVGGGPNSLPRYHTIIQLPSGSAKRGLKRSPSGWRGLFFRASKHRSLPASSPVHPTISEPTKIQTVENSNTIIDQCITKDKNVIPEKMTVDIEENRSTRSYESLGSEVDSLPPLIVIPEPQTAPSHHNRSASCDSYFEASLAELAGMRLRLTSQEREMDIFSEDDTARQGWNKDGTSSGDTTAEPSPVKATQTTVSASQNSLNHRNQVKIEEQLSDLLFIDCSTPEHTALARAAAKAESLDFPDSGVKSIKEEDENSSLSPQPAASLDPQNHQSPNTIKVKMRDRGSPRRSDKVKIIRHSHCGPFSPPKVEIEPQRHSTLIQVDWIDSDDLRDRSPNSCGYVQLQSDSESSLQIRESKDSLAKRLIESKESLNSRNGMESLHIIENAGMLTWAMQPSNLKNKESTHALKACDKTHNSENVTEVFSGLITKTASKENLDGVILTKKYESPNNTIKNGAKVFDLKSTHKESNKNNSATEDRKDAITENDTSASSDFVNAIIKIDNQYQQNPNYENMISMTPSNVNNQKYDMTTSSGSENFHYDDVEGCDSLLNKPKTDKNIYSDLETDNRCSVTVTPSDENFSSNIADSLEDSMSPSNISYQNLNRLSTISGESGKVNISKESTPTYSPHEQEKTEEIYECFSFARPSYIHLASSSGGSTPTSPPLNKASPLKSTISITYKSPTKENANAIFSMMPKTSPKLYDEHSECGIYEDIGDIENKSLVTDSSEEHLPIKPADENPVNVNNTNSEMTVNFKPNFLIAKDTKFKRSELNDADIYNKVKFFKQSVNEVNSLIMESDGDLKDESLYDDSLDGNLDTNVTIIESPKETKKALFINSHANLEGEYENINYYNDNSLKVKTTSESHCYENMDIKKPENNVIDGHSTSICLKISPLTELCYDRHLQNSHPKESKNVYESFCVDKSDDGQKLRKDNAITVPDNCSSIKANLGESDKENSDENENLTLSNGECNLVKRSSVKQLAHKFESPTENKSAFYFDRSSKTNLSVSDRSKDSQSQAFDKNKSVSFCKSKEKLNFIVKTIPSIRAKNHRLAKHSSNTRSLDENAFVKEFVNQSLHEDHISEIDIDDHFALYRRKSLEALKCLNQPKKLPDLNLNIECNKACSIRPNLSLNLDICSPDDNVKENYSLNFANRYASITPTTENKICLVQARISPKKNTKCKQFYTGRWEPNDSSKDISEDISLADYFLDRDLKKDQLSRERIEKYKEERRLFLREKYSSQSFRGLNDIQVVNKYKGNKNDDFSFEGVQLRNPGKLERRNTADATQRSKFSIKMSEMKSNDNISEFQNLNSSGNFNTNFQNEMNIQKENFTLNSDRPKITDMHRKLSLDGSCGNKNYSIGVVNRHSDKINNMKDSPETSMYNTKPSTSSKFSCEQSKPLGTSNSLILCGVSEEKDSMEDIKVDALTSPNRKEKRSPSFNIKDMAAIFEQKSINNQINQN